MNRIFSSFLPLAACLGLAAGWLGSSSARASTAYGSINNFDTVNDTGGECHGFEIELEDIHSTDVTYTYDWNHYGTPLITEDNSVAGHPKTVVRYAAKKKPDGTWTAYTAIPAGPISPTDGHQFTNPAVNFGGEHFGVGYRANPTAVKYHWLVDNGAGALVQGPAVQVSTPVFTYLNVGAIPQVQAAIQPPEAPHVKEFGNPVWVKEIRTTTHNNNKVKLRQLVSDDPDDADDRNWRNGEPDEVETEWQLLQKEFAQADGGANGELQGAAEDLPNGDEVVTRRYEFFKYTGPLDDETGEAMCDNVDADGIHGSGVKTVNGVEVDLSTLEVVGEFTGSQMAAVDVDAVVGLIDHLQDGSVNTPYPARTLVIGGNTPFTATTTGELPPGMTFDAVTGVVSGTPTAAGTYSLTVTAEDATTAPIEKVYTMTVAAAGAALDASSLLDTASDPVIGGTTTGSGAYETGTQATVTATPAPGYVFVNWTENGAPVSNSAAYTLTMDVHHSLVAHFSQNYTIATSSSPAAGGTTTGGGTYPGGTNITVTAAPANGYAFSQWTENGAAVSLQPAYSFEVGSNRALVAVFVPGQSYTVSLAASPVDGGTVSGGGTFANGTSITVSATANAGYAFTSWKENGAVVSNSQSYTFPVTGNRTLTAQFQATAGSYTIATASTPVAGGTTSGGGSYAAGSNVTVVATPAANYMFKRWLEGGSNVSSSPSYTFVATANRTLTAKFARAYAITTSSDPVDGGTTDGGGLFEDGDNVTVEANENDGYDFLNWTENGTIVSTDKSYRFKANPSRSLVAHFVPSNPGDFVVSVSAQPANGGTVDGGGIYAENDDATVTATPAPGFAFIHWTVGAAVVSDEPVYSFPVTGNVSLVAHFGAVRTVTTGVQPAEGGSTSGDGDYASGSSATVEATPNPGYMFDHWTDNGTTVSTAPSFTFTVTTDHILVAHFTETPIADQILFDFDTASPMLAVGQAVPFLQTAGGVTATFSTLSAAPFAVQPSSGLTLSGFSGQLLHPGAGGNELEIHFDQPLADLSLAFATTDAAGTQNPASIHVLAYFDSTTTPPVADFTVAAAWVAGDSLPTGTAEILPSSAFNIVKIAIVPVAGAATGFLVDTLTGHASSGSLQTLANPNWNITLSDFGYSDLLLDNTPGFEGREYLSGEWGGAVGYTVGGQNMSPRWLDPNFIYPDWTTNSNFHVVKPLTHTGQNADGLPIADSIVANPHLQITLRHEMLDTVTGVPMGVSRASVGGAGTSVNSNRYVLKETVTVKNIAAAPVTGLEFFQMLHGLISQRGVFDNRTYAGALAEYRYDTILAGVDASSAGAESSATGLEDYIGFHSKVAPTAFEIGRYGISGIDDHGLGKPSDGVHLSIEANWLGEPYATRMGTDFLAPAEPWVAGAQRWSLGALQPGESASVDFLLTILTGTKVVGTGGNSGGGNGGSSHPGGCDYEFEDLDEDGSFFVEYSHADDDELEYRIDDDEFTPFSFTTPSGPRQLWNLTFSGAFSGNVHLTFAYDPQLLPAGFDESQLSIFHYTGGAWHELAGIVDPVANTIRVTTTSFSPFVLGLTLQAAPPTLSNALMAADTLRLSWPTDAAGWILQESADLSTWTPSNRPVQQLGAEKQVIVSPMPARAFFRLVRP